MSGSLNKATIIGRLGKDPETKTFQNGGIVCNISLATSENWKDKATGERKEKTEWHRVAIFNEHIAKIVQSYCKKGDMIYIEGQIETRKWTDQSGVEKYTTEIVLRPFNGAMTILNSGKKSEGEKATSVNKPDNNEEIPF